MNLHALIALYSARQLRKIKIYCWKYCFGLFGNARGDINQTSSFHVSLLFSNGNFHFYNDSERCGVDNDLQNYFSSIKTSSQHRRYWQVVDHSFVGFVCYCVQLCFVHSLRINRLNFVNRVCLYATFEQILVREVGILPTQNSFSVLLNRHSIWWNAGFNSLLRTYSIITC